MKSREEGHVIDRIQAFLDGELGEDEAGAIDRHVASCGGCSEELERAKAVRGALSADAEASPLRPMWPAVKSRMYRESRPGFSLSFGFATAVAAAAGLVIGISLGSRGMEPESDETVYTGSIMGTEEILSLDQVYVTAFEEGGEAE